MGANSGTGLFRRLSSGVLLLIALFAGIAAAAEVEDLYEAQVPVTGQAETERLRALGAAFEAVLVKVTGRRESTAEPDIAAALQRPMNYVQQYLYTPLAPVDGSPYTESIHVRFDARAVDALVQRAGVPLWGRERPATLLWVAVDEGDRRYLLSADDVGELRDALEDEARRRGLPALFPLLDLEDRRNVSFTDVWGNFRSVVTEASARYQVAAVAVARLLRERDGRWSARWSLYHEGAEDHWSIPAGEAPMTIAGGIDAIADTLAARYARSSPQGSGAYADMVVAGIDSLPEYRRAMRYLERLDQVRELKVIAVEADRAVFRVRIDGDAETLARTVAFGKTLVATPLERGSVPGEPEVATLSYRLLP
ncbi:MAG: DUF2066 domain-containing protein [Gammaproteobacteria bacterium]|jgi:hypothetical protein|nr:DUF2066 domain-containing protein [Gammaproteobacteria bacterium]